MKVINKILYFSVVCFNMIFVSCKTVKTVSFENRQFDQFESNLKMDTSTLDEFYFTRVSTVADVNLVFYKFSVDKKFDDLKINNILISDDQDNIIITIDKIIVHGNGFENKMNNIPYQIYSYSIDSSELDRITFKQYKTKFINLNYEINGIKYSEQLYRKEEKSLLLPT